MTLPTNPQEPPVYPSLDIEVVRGRLHDLGRTGQIVHLARCDSTNEQAAAVELHPDGGSDDGSAGGSAGGLGGTSQWALVVAEEQTAGRGRLSRSWASPPGAGLLFSIALSAPSSPAQLSLLPLLVGLAVARQCHNHGVPARVKWPNDIIVTDSEGVMGKLGGVLLERTAQAVVVGVGLNVFAAPDSAQAPEGASLGDHGLLAVEGVREVLLADVTVAILDTWEALVADQARELVSDYRTACATLGRQVRAALPDGSFIVGEAVDIDETGRLLVVPDGGDPRTPASGVVALSAADIVHVRNA